VQKRLWRVELYHEGQLPAPWTREPNISQHSKSASPGRARPIICCEFSSFLSTLCNRKRAQRASRFPFWQHWKMLNI
jgi:hypothetical protein